MIYISQEMEREIGRTVLWCAAPIATVVLAGSVMESKLKATAAKTTGAILQMIPLAGMTCCRFYSAVEDALFWHGISNEALFHTTDQSPEALRWWQSIGTPAERAARANFWTPKIMFGMTSLVLFSPLLIQGLRKIAQTYQCHRLEVLLNSANQVLMVAVKITNLSLNLLGITVAVASSSPLLTGVYSAFFLLNLYSCLSQYNLWPAALSQKNMHPTRALPSFS